MGIHGLAARSAALVSGLARGQVWRDDICRGSAMLDFQIAGAIFALAMTIQALNHVAQYRHQLQISVLQDYSTRLLDVMNSYSSANLNSLANSNGAVSLSAVVTSQSFQSVATTTPLGQTPKLYAVGGTSNVVMYAQIPMSAILDGANLASDLCNNLGSSCAVVTSSGQITSSAGQWSIASSTLTGAQMTAGDLVLRSFYVQPGT